MNLDSPHTRGRRAWRGIAALGCLLGATGILLAAVLTNRVDANAQRGALAICAIIDYGNDTLGDIKTSRPPRTAAQKQATERFRKLVFKMRATRIKCPPPSNP
jgi:predicted naringenin-chalcone synthase